MEKRALRTNDIEPPTGPILDVRADFLAQFGDGKESLNLGALQVLDFNPCIVDDLFMIVHKMEEAAHFGTVTPSKTFGSASGFCRRSEETFGPGSLLVFGRPFPHGIETVQGNPADIGPWRGHEISASVL